MRYMYVCFIDESRGNNFFVKICFAIYEGHSVFLSLMVFCGLCIIEICFTKV